MNVAHNLWLAVCAKVFWASYLIPMYIHFSRSLLAQVVWSQQNGNIREGVDITNVDKILK